MASEQQIVLSGPIVSEREDFNLSGPTHLTTVDWAKYGIEEMCRDQWNWASKNPYGYESQ